MLLMICNVVAEMQTKKGIGAMLFFPNRGSSGEKRKMCFFLKNKVAGEKDGSLLALCMQLMI